MPQIYKNTIKPADPAQEPNNERTHEVYISLEEIEGKIYSDQIGRFPRTSNCRMKYVMIFYIYDANYVKGIPIQNCIEDEFLLKYEETCAKLTNKGYCPKFNNINN